jgi:hypothetical protein
MAKIGNYSGTDAQNARDIVGSNWYWSSRQNKSRHTGAAVRHWRGWSRVLGRLPRGQPQTHAEGVFLIALGALWRVK